MVKTGKPCIRKYIQAGDNTGLLRRSCWAYRSATADGIPAARALFSNATETQTKAKLEHNKKTGNSSGS